MPREPLVLAFDTSAAHCAAALLKGEQALGSRLVIMGRGQAEHLMPLLEELLSDHGHVWWDIDALAVGVGPGNFTGIRIAVSAARGLALSLDIPAFGVSSFEVMASGTGTGTVLVSLEAPRGMAYVQRFENGKAASEPELIDPEAPPAGLRLPEDALVTGWQAEQIAARLGADFCDAMLEQIAERIGVIATCRLREGATPARPSPLYVRAADAAPPSDTPPVILP